MISKHFLCLTCLISCLVSLTLAPVCAQGVQPVQVCLTPASIQVALEQTADVAVEVRDAEAIYGADVSLTFDPAVVEVVDADPNTDGVQVALGTFLDPGFVLLNAADNAAGTLRFAMTQLNPSEPKSGSGNVIVIKLRGLQVAAGSLLTLTRAQVAQRDGTKPETTLVSGQVAVVTAASVQATYTPIPTQGAGTVMPTSTHKPTSIPAPATATLPPATATAEQQTKQIAATTTATPLPPAEIPRPTDTPDVAETPDLSLAVASTVSPSPTPTATKTAASTAEVRATPSPTTEAASAFAEATPPAGTVVALLPPSDATGTSSKPSTDQSSSVGGTLLFIGLGLLGLALLLLMIGAVLFISRRQPRSNEGRSKGL